MSTPGILPSDWRLAKSPPSQTRRRPRGPQRLGHAGAGVPDGGRGVGFVREDLEVEGGLGLELRRSPPARRSAPRRGRRCLGHADVGGIDGDRGK
eukprot:4594086-Alexandrium_andersonii.AAC.1